MPEEPHIPPRNTEWETPFSDVAAVNADADATKLVGTFSPRRRAVAIVVTVLVVAWVIGEIVHVIQYTADQGVETGRVFGVIGMGVVIFRLVVSGAITWLVWRWAQRPVPA